MTDERIPDRKRAGTYLFVRPKTARRPRVKPAADASGPETGDSSDSETGRDENFAPRSTRLRYRRPRLAPEALDGRLVFFVSPDAGAAEQYRQVAEVLVRDKTAPRRLWVAGATLGVGATLTAANLGCALTEHGRVTLVDAASTKARRTLSSLFGIRPTPGGSLTGETLDLWLLSDRLALLADAHLLPLTPERQETLRTVAAAADFVLLDGPALDDVEAVAAMKAAVDAVLLVLRPADLGTGRYERALDRLQGFRIAGVMLNGAADAEEVLRANP